MNLMRTLIAMVIAATTFATPSAATDLWGLRFQNTIEKKEWREFADAFMQADGRIVDTANGRISHSEGQGYGMLLAWMAGERADFERIWHFTRTELQIRDDGLLAWSWDAEKSPHITDINNASDGDILVAYALLLAGNTWEDASLHSQGTALLEAIRTHLVLEHPEFGAVLMPGRFGFDDTGLIINPSYWIDEAFLTFAALDAGGPWLELTRSGIKLHAAAVNEGFTLPADWLLLPLNGGLKADSEKTSEFGFNAIRVPLYAIRAGQRPPQGVIDMIDRDGALIATTDTPDRKKVVLDAPGYRALTALISCASGKTDRAVEPHPDFTTQDYYPSAIHLLAISAVRAAGSVCLSESI